MGHDMDLRGFAAADGAAGLLPDPASPLGAGGYVWSTDKDGGRITLTHIPEAIRSAEYLVVDVYHEMPYTLGLIFEFAEAGRGDEGGCITATLGVLPSLVTRLAFPLNALDGQTIFLPRTPGRLKGTCFGRKVDPGKIGSVSLALPKATQGQKLWIKGMGLVMAEPDFPVPERKVVDPLGQWTAKEWPGKTLDAVQLKADMDGYLRSGKTAAFPAGWSRYGGWTEKRFDGTGFFRTLHDGRRWWLVDPDGHPFFSTGLDCVRPDAECYTKGNESLFAWLPPSDGEFADAWHSDRRFSFSISNAIKAWNSDWRGNWSQMTRQRLLDWGFNTVANWSDPGFYLNSGIPYVWPLGGYPTTERRIYRDFPDVFSEEYQSNAEKFALQLEPHVSDPYMIGYFLRNEPHWAFGSNNLAEELLASGAGTESVKHLWRFLAQRYGGDIATLSVAWGAEFPSFEEMAGTRNAAGISETAAKDLWDFTKLLVVRYLKPVCDACRKIDPNHLNLGIRYAWLSSDACLAGSELFDVFSINMYQMKPEEDVIRKASEASGKPVMIGEYHWGALDRGLPSTGLRAVPDQGARGDAYAYYLESGAAMPWLVGAHYFTLNDQPVLGRFDGENFQIGFVDICHKPYGEMVDRAREAHRRMYPICDGRIPPTDKAPVEVPRQGF